MASTALVTLQPTATDCIVVCGSVSPFPFHRKHCGGALINASYDGILITLSIDID